MYAVVAAAKALYEQLGEMGESSIDGDSFLDLWIYVIIKAGIKDLVCVQELSDFECVYVFVTGSFWLLNSEIFLFLVTVNVYGKYRETSRFELFGTSSGVLL